MDGCGPTALMKALMAAAQYKRQLDDATSRLQALQSQVNALSQENAVMRDVVERQQHKRRANGHRDPSPGRGALGDDADNIGVSMAWNVSTDVSDDALETLGGSFPVHAEYLLADRTISALLKAAQKRTETHQLADALIHKFADAEKARNVELIHRKRELDAIHEERAMRKCSLDCAAMLSAIDKRHAEAFGRHSRKVTELVTTSIRAVREHIVDTQRVRADRAEQDAAATRAASARRHAVEERHAGGDISASMVPHVVDTSTLPSRSAVNDTSARHFTVDSTLPDPPSDMMSASSLPQPANTVARNVAHKSGGNVNVVPLGGAAPAMTAHLYSRAHQQSAVELQSIAAGPAGSPRPDAGFATMHVTVGGGGETALRAQQRTSTVTDDRVSDSEEQLRVKLEKSKAQVAACELSKAVAALQASHLARRSRSGFAAPIPTVVTTPAGGRPLH